MRKGLALCFILCSWISVHSQFITTSTSMTVPNMVQNVLLSNNGIPSCGGTISNVSWKSGPSASSTNGIGTFTNTNPNFPMTSGMILSTGDVAGAAGPNSTVQGFGTNAWAGDAQLLAYMQAQGLNVTTYRNAAVLEFDFVPLTNIMNFDFIFASEEYGTFQCDFSDAFAFFLNNVTTGTAVENLALVPASTTPISVTTIRDAQYNVAPNTCLSANIGYFGAFYGGSAASTAPINFNGRTTKMQANKIVVAGQTYHIKFVIADRNDTQYDSAVFLGNFTTGEFVSGTGAYSGLGDLSNASNQAVCNAPTGIQAGPNPIANASYSWTLNNSSTPITGANQHIYIVTQPGTYTVLMTLPNGCQLTDSIVVDFLPVIPVNPAGDLTTCIGSTFNLNLKKPIILGTLSASSHPIRFFTSLSNAENFMGALTNAQAMNFPGTQGQEIWARLDDESNGNGCFTIQSFILNFTPLITPTFTQIGPFCIGDSFTLPVSSTNSPAVTGTWFPAPNNTITTTYTFTPDASFPCAVPVTMTVVINNTPTTPTFNAVPAVCEGGVIAPLPTSSTNTPSISGTWSPPLNNTTTTTYTFTPASGSCATTASLQVVVNPAPTVTVNSPSVCSGLPTTITATAGAAGSYSYAWTVPPTATPPGNVASFSTDVAGTYSVIITNTVTNCPSASASGTVTLIPLPTVTVTSPAACAGSSTTVTAVPGASGSYSYAWTVPATVTPPGNVPNFTTTVAGTYSVIITDTATTCVSASGSSVVVLNPIPTATVANATVCSGSPATLNAVPGTGVAADYSFAWTVPSGATNPGNINSFTTLIAGTYSVIITRLSTGCPSVAASATVTLNPAPTVTVNSPSVCSGLPTTITATAGAAGSYSYAWTVPPTATSPGNVASFSTDVAGTYSVIITNTVTNCPSASASGTVTLIPLPTVTVTSPAACAGSSTTVTAVPGASGSYSYAWTVPATVTPPGNVPNFTTTVAGTYSVIITDTATTCVSASGSSVVVLNPIPTATVANATVCSGSPATLNAVPGTGVAADYSFAWTVPSGATNPGNINSFTTLIAGTYSVIITRLSTGCPSVAASATVTVNATPVATVTSSSVCNGTATTVSVTATTSGPFSYAWSVPTGAVAVGNVASFSTTVAGTYSVVVTNTLSNCPSATASGTVTVNAIPTVAVNSPSACFGSSATLIATAGNPASYSYLWSVPSGVTNPGSVASFQTTTAGNYSVVITNIATGCFSASASGTVTINPNATVSVASAAVCEGTPASVLATPGNGVAADYTFAWTVPAGVVNPGNVNSFTTAVAGNYSVIITRIATNCPSASAAVTVQINPKPVVVLAQNGYICVNSSGVTIPGSGSSFVLDTALSSLAYGFEWFTNGVSNGVTTSSFTAVAPADYKVIVKNLTTLCTTTATATVVPSLPPTSLTLTASDYFENNQTITVTVLPAGIYEYQIDNGAYQDSNVFNNLDSGVHAVTVRDKKACGSVGDSIMTIDYPHFFTPNGDGYNDKWNVNDLKSSTTATIVYIYDRYGKLLKQISVNGEGWDGTYNGTDLISDDYWFKIMYTEKGVEKQFKAHFSLKR